MEPATWKRLRAAFEGALALEPAERSRFLDQSCGADGELRARVEELLRQDVDRGAPLQPPWRAEIDARAAGAAGVPEQRIGPYEIERVIGHGGMGTVFLARRADEHFQKRVALKLIRRGMDTDDILRRFRNERQVLADLEHPGIARLLDGGATEDGRPYLVLEYVEGERLDAHCDRCRLATRARLELFREVCAAVHHAHEHRVVHRDLKPSNILVTAEGRAKLLDFGIAKVLDPEDSQAEAERTATAQRFLTPEYASPEHIRGGAISVASDVFGLGVILYELLSGHRPHGTSVESPAELVRAICEEDPLPPSACVGRPVTTADGPIEPAHLRDATTQRLRRALRGDLDTIVLMALRKEPERRYRSAAALAEDIGRHLAGQPVHARRDTWRYRAGKFVRRNGVLVGATASLVLVLAGGLATSLTYKARSDANARLAQDRAILAEENERRALAGEEHARREKVRADAEADTARRTADDLLRLSALQRLEDLTAAADRLWPAHPPNLPEYEEWLGEARELVAELPDHEAKLAELRARSDGPELRFADAQDRWWHNQLVKLVEGLVAFSDPASGLASSGTSPEHGWSVEKRAEFARTIAARSVSGADASGRWAEAIASLADASDSPAYGGLSLTPQLGLLPIGRDPDSGLWEFAHLQTGEPAVRGADGRLQLEEETGLVFVLLPGGSFRMGAQSGNPSGPNYDPQAAVDEGPVLREVKLAPFFFSKYEMTQGQWLRFAGTNPSRDSPQEFSRSLQRFGQPGDLLHPVEQVSWNACTEMLRRLGLDLPSEAQWEYGARAGTTTVWWCGNDKTTIAAAGNVADLYARAHGGSSWGAWEAWDDGNASHARVGSYDPNPFGLHDVIGNVWEWCEDLFSPGSAPRVSRGGGFGNLAVYARSANRDGDAPSANVGLLGLRPARALH